MVRNVVSTLRARATVLYPPAVAAGPSTRPPPISDPDARPGPGEGSSGVGVAFSDRVRLYLKVTSLINLLFAVVVLAILLLDLDPVYSRRSTPRNALIWSVTTLNGMAWFAIARSRHTVLTALVTEGVATLVLVGAYATVLLVMNPAVQRADSVFALLLTTIILVLRSSLVPSPTLATAVIGLLATSIPVTLATLQIADTEALFFVWQGIIGAVVVIVTSVTSATIYGLHRDMRVAQRLGQYQLQRRVGQGGMGEVYLATHSLLQRPTAIKLLRDVTSPNARARFRQEVQTASGLTHPNTVEIYDYGRTPLGVFYFAMEFVEGASLEDVIAATGPMPATRVVRLLEQAAGSLAEAHGRGLVHRNIKPANLMLCERGGDFDTLKVLDFGLVREVAHQETDDAEALAGTPFYMAPEVILDPNGYAPESDGYALGATAYFMLTGSPPFPATDLVEVLSDHLATEPRRPDSDDAALVELVLDCLSKHPDDRPDDAAAIRARLRRCESFGRWTLEDARVWWAEHREIIEATQAAHRSEDTRRPTGEQFLERAGLTSTRR